MSNSQLYVATGVVAVAAASAVATTATRRARTRQPPLALAESARAALVAARRK